MGQYPLLRGTGTLLSNLPYFSFHVAKLLSQRSESDTLPCNGDVAMSIRSAPQPTVSTINRRRFTVHYFSSTLREVQQQFKEQPSPVAAIDASPFGTNFGFLTAETKRRNETPRSVQQAPLCYHTTGWRVFFFCVFHVRPQKQGDTV